MASAVEWIAGRRAAAEIGSVEVAGDSVAIDGRVMPHIRCQIGMVIVDPRINDGNDDALTTRCDIPGLRGPNVVSRSRAAILPVVLQIPLLVEIGSSGTLLRRTT